MLKLLAYICLMQLSSHRMDLGEQFAVIHAEVLRIVDISEGTVYY